MLFFSGVFFPLDKFPVWVKSFAQFLPLTHAVTISRSAFSGDYVPGLPWDFLYLVLYRSGRLLYWHKTDEKAIDKIGTHS